MQLVLDSCITERSEELMIYAYHFEIRFLNNYNILASHLVYIPTPYAFPVAQLFFYEMLS